MTTVKIIVGGWVAYFFGTQCSLITLAVYIIDSYSKFRKHRRPVENFQ